jgi:Tfp pilus assembly protein PilF
LLTLLRTEGDAVERARRLEAWLARAPDAAERSAAWRELAQLREERLGDPRGAADAWRQLLEFDPEALDGWAGVRRCAERCGDAEGLARALEAEIEHGIGSVGSRWRRLGRLRWRELGDAAGAEAALVAARAAEPDELTALATLQEIAACTGRFERAASLAAEEIELLGDADPARCRALWLRIAEIASRQVPDPQRAAQAFERVHSLGACGAAELAGWAAALNETGPRDRWCDVFASWCDHRDARPTAVDLLQLAASLVERGQANDAEARLRRALALDPACAGAWRLSAQLRTDAGDRSGAAEAWLQAAAHETAVAAADAGTRGAALLEEDAPERALAALERAAACAPGFAPAEAALARVAAANDRPETALAAAIRLFAPDRDADSDADLIGPAQRLAAALAGARTARRLARWQAAWHLAGVALSLDPEAWDALAARGLAAFHLGATGECRRDLAARLAQPAPDPCRIDLLVALARALEDGGDLEAALERHAEALTEAPDHEDAHAGRLRVLERLGHRKQAAEALAAWAAHTEPATRRAERYVRAARLARLADSDRQQVEQWLLEALAAESSHPTAWYELATGLWEDGRADEALAAASEGVSCVASPSVRAVLETVRGRALEARGDDAAARAAYAAAIAVDPEAREAALAGARLWRLAGDWQQAAELLRRGAEGHGDAGERAELFFERGRLLAGPLEDVAGALEAYDRAQALAPERLDVREVRAALLGQLPERRHEALRELAAVLDAAPLRSDAIRRATRITRALGDEASARRGAALLRAFGVASPLERDTAPSRIDLACAAAMSPLDPASEALRKAIATLSPLMAAQAAGLQGLPGADPALADVLPATDAGSDVRTQWLDAGRTLVGAPELLALDGPRLRAAVEGTLAAARDGAFGRPGTRALRKLDGRTLSLVDLAAWRIALTARVWARVVDARDGDLRAVLARIASDAGAPAVADDDDLTPWLAEAPEATALLRAVLHAWLDEPG